MNINPPMKFKLYLIALLFTPFSHADPCRRLLNITNAFDFDGAATVYDLESEGYLKIRTPLRLDTGEVNEIFAQRAGFTAPGWHSRQRQIDFRIELGWNPKKRVGDETTEEELVPPLLKEFGMTTGRKLEGLLRSKLPAEDLHLTNVIIRWVSSKITLPSDDGDEYRGPLAHTDLGNVYLNSVLTIHGDGTHIWESEEVPEAPTGLTYRDLLDYHPSFDQTQPGEILVLTGHGRATALNRPRLATFHSPPKTRPGEDRLIFLFYYAPKRGVE